MRFQRFELALTTSMLLVVSATMALAESTDTPSLRKTTPQIQNAAPPATAVARAPVCMRNAEVAVPGGGLDGRPTRTMEVAKAVKDDSGISWGEFTIARALLAFENRDIAAEPASRSWGTSSVGSDERDS